MTEVTRKNFHKLLPEIEQRVKSCTFISVDAEYTGLYAEKIEDSNSLFDTAADRYTKLKKNTGSFAISQIGVSFYEKSRDSDENHAYIVNAYDFFVFPVAFDSFAKREVLLTQVSCLNFLTKNNFDFNKFIREGVPYLNKEKTDSLQKFLKVNRHFMNTCEHIDEDYFPAKKEYLTDEDIATIIDRLQGFSKVIKMIQKSNKPLVGHNMLMDLLLIYQQFCEELPDSYLEFKRKLHEMFPVVYDTKCLAWGINILRQQQIDPDDRILSDTNLFALYSNLSAILVPGMRPRIDPVNETQKYQEALLLGNNKNLEGVASAECHNAGFDAVVTGAVFLKLGYLACRPKPMPVYKQGLPPTMTELLKRVSCWKDEVNLGRATIPNIHLSQPDPESRRPDWIRVRRLKDPKIIDPGRVRQELAKYGDFEIEVIGPDEIILACGGIGGARKIWKHLDSKGYQLSIVKPSMLTEKFWTLSFRCGAVLTMAIALYIVSKRSLK